MTSQSHFLCLKKPRGLGQSPIKIRLAIPSKFPIHGEPAQLGGSCPGDRFRGIQGEQLRVESMLRSKELDLSKGYMIFKDLDHTVSIVGSSKGLQIFMDGKLLKGGANEAKC